MVAITALNGRIPTGLLASVPGGHLLRMDAAESLARLSAAMDAAGHGPLLLSPGRSAYRTLADQRYMIAIGLTTMPAGKSQHGEAVAADLAGLGGYDGARYRWLAKHGPAYGWTQPAWARQHGALPEPWHWEYDPRADQHPTAQEDDDMALTPEQDNLLRHLVAMVGEVPGRTATAVANVPVSRVAGKPSTWLQDTADGTTAALSTAAQVAALTAAVQALATGHGVDPAAITAAAQAGARQALADLRFTVTAD